MFSNQNKKHHVKGLNATFFILATSLLNFNKSTLGCNKLWKGSSRYKHFLTGISVSHKRWHSIDADKNIFIITATILVWPQNI